MPNKRTVTVKLARFSEKSRNEIQEYIKNSISKDTVNCQKSISNQLQIFLIENNDIVESHTSNAELGIILKDCAFNMKRFDGRHYEESVKTAWNVITKSV